MYIQRLIEADIIKSLDHYPVTALIGPRQSGKSTLVKQLLQSHPTAITLDLERPSDLSKLDDAEWFFENTKGTLIFLDEIQRKSELFPLIRSLVDDWGGNGHFIISGSATPELLRQSSESLAGRIKYHTLMPFIWQEINQHCKLEDYLVSGGFPRSILSKHTEQSMDWRQSFIQTYLERDLSFWSGFSTTTMLRLWQMLAHTNGQSINYSRLASALGVSNVTVKNYIDLLESTFMVKTLVPKRANVGKRLVKAQKVYLTDTGIINALLHLPDFNTLTGHPVFGSLWESLVITQLMAHFPLALLSYYRTSNGSEIDVVVEVGGKQFSIECKNSLSPTLTKGNHIAFHDLDSNKNMVVAPVSKGWPLSSEITVVSLEEMLAEIQLTTGQNPKTT
ncbi:MAG: ATP-binding protein [Bacteroidetes bacterium]|jgi:uncharacterized protein|nr:ATP-binding protein [Bacteroidota bacterium]